MDRGAWQATDHEVGKELDTTYRLHFHSFLKFLMMCPGTSSENKDADLHQCFSSEPERTLSGDVCSSLPMQA